jgi:hypothetical protein
MDYIYIYIYIHTQKREAKIETAEMKFLRRVKGCKGKDQTGYTKIMEKLKIFNLNNKILKSRSQWKHHVQRTEDGRIPKKIFAAQREDET